MIWVTLAAVTALPVVCVAFIGALARQSRAHVRREDQLVNQLLHAAGKPWQPSPDSELRRSERQQIPDAWEARFTPSPEQEPVY